MIPAVIERCAGIDVGKKFLVACVMTGPAKEMAVADVRKFGTIRPELEALRNWLQSEGCTHVVMESTGVYWKPVLNVLEDDPEYSPKILLANPQQVKAVTGHKTDPHDAKWLAHLLRHAMIRPSFIPSRAIRELRDFTRRRKQMIGAAAQERNRVQKILEDANVKIGDVLTDVFGLSGQLMLEALVKGLDGKGQPSAFDIAQLARGHARKKLDQLRSALEGHQMRNSHRILILHALRHMAFLAEETEALDQDIATLIREANLIEAYELLQTIPGIKSQAAATILAESGPDMKQFPTGAKFSSWSGVAPGNNESAGKRKRAPAMKGNPHIKTALVEAAWSAARTKRSEFEDRYRRLAPRIRHKRAVVATAHLLALRVHQVLDSCTSYQPKAGTLTPLAAKRLVRHHTHTVNYFKRWLNNEERGPA